MKKVGLSTLHNTRKKPTEEAKEYRGKKRNLMHRRGKKGGKGGNWEQERTQRSLLSLKEGEGDKGKTFSMERTGREVPVWLGNFAFNAKKKWETKGIG